MIEKLGRISPKEGDDFYDVSAYMLITMKGKINEIIDWIEEQEKWNNNHLSQHMEKEVND